MQLSKASKKNLESCVHKKKAEICMLMSLVHICIMFYQSVFFFVSRKNGPALLARPQLLDYFLINVHKNIYFRDQIQIQNRKGP